MSSNDPNKIEMMHCNRCLRINRHKALATRIRSEPEEVDDSDYNYTIDWEITDTMLECLGCSNVTLRRKIFSSAVDVNTVDYFPPQISRQAPRWRVELPHDFRSLMEEIYTALHANSRRLALMGARTLVDLFMNETIGDIGGFEKKLKKLVDDGHLSKRDMETLEPALDAGHAATHRAHNPTTDDVNLVIDIVENLLQPLALKKKVDTLKKNTPGR